MDGSETQTLKIDRIDATIVNIDAGEKFYFRDQYGASTHMGYW